MGCLAELVPCFFQNFNFFFFNIWEVEPDCSSIAFKLFKFSWVLEFSPDQMSDLEKRSGNLCSVPFHQRTIESVMKKCTQGKRMWWMHLTVWGGRQGSEHNSAYTFHNSLIFWHDTYNNESQFLPVPLTFRGLSSWSVSGQFILQQLWNNTALSDTWLCFRYKHMLASHTSPE